MNETVVSEQKAVKKVIRPESASIEYEVILRTNRGTFQKILWGILSVLFVLLGVYAMAGGSNPFLP
jgi:hypothetical protein